MATVPDLIQLPRIQDGLATHHLLPAEHLVDAGYPSAKDLISSRKHQVDLVGPAYPDRGWQAKAKAGFDVAAFHLDWERQIATCPTGRQSIRWGQTHTARQRTMIHVDFAASDCFDCPVRSACTRAQTIPRSLTLQPREEHEAMQLARAREVPPEFKLQYARRAGIEGTFSQGVQSCGLRRSRYRGQAKTHLQHVATAAAINVSRLTNWLERGCRWRRRVFPTSLCLLKQANTKRICQRYRFWTWLQNQRKKGRFSAKLWYLSSAKP